MYLRAAWEAPDDRHRGWYIFKMREAYGQFAQAVALPPPNTAALDPDDLHVVINEKTKRAIYKRYRGICRYFAAGSFVGGTAVRPSTDLDVLDARQLKSKDFDKYQEMVRYLRAWAHTWRHGPRKPPPQTEFEQAAFHFQRVAMRARCCNNPDCLSPYFFIVKKGQKYCSSKCAGAGEREAKRRWWHENKARLRQSGH
jgi:hypothetical protein